VSGSWMFLWMSLEFVLESEGGQCPADELWKDSRDRHKSA
jgi:hypothetical protein